MDAVITQHEVKSSLLKRGYLVKDVKSYPAIITVATVARANIPKAEREKMQKDMDSNEKPAN
jgi:hypothetical protein